MNRASLIAFHTTGLFLLVPLYFNGWLLNIYNEPTKISAGIFLALLGGVVLSLFKRWRHVEFFADMSVFGGLFGTVVGIILAFSDLDPGRLSDISYAKDIGTALLSGVSVALYTTLVGAVSFMWLNATVHFWGHRS